MRMVHYYTRDSLLPVLGHLTFRTIRLDYHRSCKRMAQYRKWARLLNSNRRLSFIICKPRKTNFRFCFRLQQTNGSLPFPVSCLQQINNINIYTYKYIYLTENGIPGDFPHSVYRLLTVQTEVCRFSVCYQRNKKKEFSFCGQQAKRTKQTGSVQYFYVSIDLKMRYTSLHTLLG
jgi:hypothetical protein